MVGKIVQLVGKKLDSGFEITYGIDDHIIDNRYSLGFGEILLGNSTPNVTTTYIYGGYTIGEYGDGYKRVIIFNKELPEEAKEDTLLVVIPYSTIISTNAKKIAGRYYYEAILEMKNQDIVEVSKSLTGKTEIYMAVEAGNEMFLIKKER